MVRLRSRASQVFADIVDVLRLYACLCMCMCVLSGELLPMETLHAALRAPLHLFVVSGLHMVDAPVRGKRFKDVSASLASFRERFPRTPLHVELASVSDRVHMDYIAASALSVADSAGVRARCLLADSLPCTPRFVCPVCLQAVAT